MGRRAKNNKPFKIEHIQQPSKRNTTAASRAHGLMKKAAELAKLTNTKVFLTTMAENGVVTVFASEQSSSRDGAKKQLEQVYNTIGDDNEYVQVYNKENALNTFGERRIVYRHPLKACNRKTIYNVKETRTKKMITDDGVKDQPKDVDSEMSIDQDPTVSLEDMQRLLEIATGWGGEDQTEKSEEMTTSEYIHNGIEHNMQHVVPNVIETIAEKKKITATTRSIETSRHTRAELMPSIGGKMTIQTTQTVEVRKMITLDIKDDLDRWNRLLDDL